MNNIAIFAADEQTKFILEELEQQQVDINKIYLITDDEEDIYVEFTYLQNDIAKTYLNNIPWDEIELIIFAKDLTSSDNLKLFLSKKIPLLDLQGVTAFMEQVPTILPGINDSDFDADAKIISLPNPIVSQALLTLQNVIDFTALRGITLLNFLPTVFFGDDGPKKLIDHTLMMLQGNHVDEDSIAFSIKPIDDAVKYNNMLMMQINKILPNNNYVIDIHSIKTPTTYTLTQKIHLAYAEFKAPHTINAEIKLYENYNALLENTRSLDDGILGFCNTYQTEHSMAIWNVADIQKYLIAHLGVQLLKLYDTKL